MRPHQDHLQGHATETRGRGHRSRARAAHSGRATPASGASAREEAGAKTFRFRRDIQGLRAVAIVLVVLYHVGLGTGGGYIGVDVFFVISGFLITGQLVRELRDRRKISFLGFYARRIRRILPAATVTIVATAIAAREILTPQAAQRAFGDAVAAVFYGANFRFAIEGANYFNSSLPPSPLLHFWSLGVEEQFYLVWPLLLVVTSLVWTRRAWRRRDRGEPPVRGEQVLRRPPSLRAVIGVLGGLTVSSFVLSLLQTTTSPSWAYYSIATRAWELSAGALAALATPLVARRLGPRSAALLSWLGLAVIAACGALFNDTTPFPGVAALAPVLGALGVILGGSGVATRKGAAVVLDSAPFQLVGAWSYSWYLWHWPVLIFAESMVGHTLRGIEVTPVIVLGLGLAIVSYYLIEQPLRRVQIVVRRPRLGLAGAAGLASTSLTAVALAAFSLPVLSGGGPAVHPALDAHGTLTAAQLAADLRAGVATKAIPVNLTPPLATASQALPVIVQDGCHLQRSGTKSRPCVFGDIHAKTTVVLFGDSHAAAWFPALSKIAIGHQWRLVDITKAGCPPVEVTIANYPQCVTWRNNALRQIAQLHPSLAIVSWARYLEDPESAAESGIATSRSAWVAGTNALFSFLKANSAQTLFISDTPTMSALAPDCLSGHLSNATSCTTPRRAATLLPKVKAKEISSAKRHDSRVLDPTGWFCTPTRCPVIVGNLLLYRDNAHMTPEYANFIAPVLSAVLVPLLTTHR